MPRFPLLMLIAFAFTLFTSATLLFLVEPMIGKMILPLLGGTPAVWNTCMVFYQAVLLAGYAYAHFSTSWLGPRKQAAFHLVMLALPFLFLPLAVNPNLIKGGENPILGLLMLLSMTVGLPMFVVSASAPLLQKWFADTSHPAAADPYFLYGASNLGSMLALLAYPTVVEPYLRLGQQSVDWTVGYGGLAALTALCAVFLWRSPRNLELSENLLSGGRKPPEPSETQGAYAPRSESSTSIQPSKHGIVRASKHVQTTPAVEVESSATLAGDVTWMRVLRWVALAFVPSSLMLGATTYMTTDIAAIAFLWVTPLALYLLSFIIVFSKIPPWLQWLGLTMTGAAIGILLTVFLWDMEQLAAVPLLHLPVRIGLVLALGGGIFASWWGWFNRHADMVHRVMVLIMPPLVLALLFFLLSGWKWGIGWSLCLHLAALFVVAMVCHGELARDRPATKYLTGYYLWMSVGGVLGGLFNALLAPVIFTGLVEYPLAMMLACLLAPPLGPSDESSWGRRFDIVLASLFGILGLLLIALRLPDHDLDFEDLRNAPWQWELAALTVGVVIGAVWALRGKEREIDRWMDLALPLCLGVLLIGLSWGLRADIVWPRLAKIAGALHINVARLLLVCTFGLPLVLAYTFVERSQRFAMAVGAILLASGFCSVFDNPMVLRQERGFFGVLKVSHEIVRYGDGADFVLRRLDHGTTLHGMQCLNEERRDEPLTYYHYTGPVGQLMLAYNGPDTPPEKMNMAVIGLGTGCMAAHARPGQHLTFYDIDPIVKRFSYDDDKPYFTFVRGAVHRGATVDLIMGDARQTMERQQLNDSDKYGIIVVDAFSSDAIPIHLINLKALDIYLDKLTPDGLIVFHISNRYLDLAPVLYNLAQARGLSAVTQSDYREEEDNPPSSELMAKTSSTWVVLSPSKERLNKLLELNDWEDKRHELRDELLPLSLWPDNGTGLAGQAIFLRNILDEAMCQHSALWKPLEPENEWPDLKSVGVWTDDYSNLFSVFSWR